MAHYLVLALVSPDCDDIEAEAWRLMRPHEHDRNLDEQGTGLRRIRGNPKQWYFEGDVLPFEAVPEYERGKWFSDEEGDYSWLPYPTGATHYDYAFIGGMFDGELTGREGKGYRAKDRAANLHRNSCRVAELPESLRAHAVVTPDGTWYSDHDHSRDRSKPYSEYMAATLAAWAKRRDKILARYPDHIAVAIDAHN